MGIHNRCRWCRSELPAPKRRPDAFCDYRCKNEHRAANRKSAKEPYMREVRATNGTLWIQRPLFEQLGEDEC
jgi:hypothetical protein